jgi:hypothetical protein
MVEQLLTPKQRIVFNQEERTTLGQALKLDVGQPNEMEQIRGDYVPVRDAFGILLDATRYSKSSCNECHGRGVVVTRSPITEAHAKLLIASDPRNEHALHCDKPNSFHTKDGAMCGCARRNYEKKKFQFAELLVSKGLAKKLVGNQYELIWKGSDDGVANQTKTEADQDRRSSQNRGKEETDESSSGEARQETRPEETQACC